MLAKIENGQKRLPGRAESRLEKANSAISGQVEASYNWPVTHTEKMRALLKPKKGFCEGEKNSKKGLQLFIICP